MQAVSQSSRNLKRVMSRWGDWQRSEANGEKVQSFRGRGMSAEWTTSTHPSAAGKRFQSHPYPLLSGNDQNCVLSIDYSRRGSFNPKSIKSSLRSRRIDIGFAIQVGNLSSIIFCKFQIGFIFTRQWDCVYCSFIC